MRFDHRLVLHQWLLSLFGVQRFEELAEHLRDEALEGLDENNVFKFHEALCIHLPADRRRELPDDLLLDYDQNVVHHSHRLNEGRLRRGEEPIIWKYFQYLALLFCEIYLDRYFEDPKALRGALNAHIEHFNEGLEEADQIELFDEDDDARLQLNKLAFWMATGSGKTLLMHANILQYQHYLKKHRRQKDLNRVLLLTPNEGLSQQHLEEFQAAGILAAPFRKEGGRLLGPQQVEVIEITKLAEEMGDKQVAVEAFEGNNLVLVDEGHRGASGGGSGKWMARREKLCERGFSFEYSATFGQAVKGDEGLADLYAKGILFDYSYRYFYGDGFGKDYQILNLDTATEREHLDRYLAACVLGFYQQLKLFADRETEMRPFQLARPLWVFVGSSVTKTLSAKDASDVVRILQFLQRFVRDRSATIGHIHAVLNDGLVTATGRNLFAKRFPYLHKKLLMQSADKFFEDMMALVFNAPGGGRLYVENLKGVDGEIALRVGADNDPFGVINIGDDTKLIKKCDEAGLDTGELEFGESLFHSLNDGESEINLLIGSKKFTEGWSSWRVSTMGLMNVGKGEGAQIIQLFGRGVRLQGYDWCLKRSAKAPLPEDLQRPEHIALLETLSIFGIRADYMEKFREYLDEEGLPTEEKVEIVLPVIRDLGKQKLKTIRLKERVGGESTLSGHAFKRLGAVPTMGDVPERLQRNRVVLDWYPKIQALQSRGVRSGDEEVELNEEVITERHVAFLDLDELFFELERYKADRGWHNLNLRRSVIPDLLIDSSWYRLQIPAEQMRFDSYDRVRLWQELAGSLLKKYLERYYTFCKQQWEMPHLEYRELEADDPNLLVREDGEGYRVLVEASEQEIIDKLTELKEAIEAGKLAPFEFRGLKAVWFGRHLYQPLLALEKGTAIEISPAPLNKGERVFVADVKAFHETHPEMFEGRQFYLLRNLSRGQGIGFFEAGNFHPDFILWLVEDNRQRIIFVDPKGILHLPISDPKVEFPKTIKDIEKRLADPNVELSAFLVSNTKAHIMEKNWQREKSEIEKLNVVFQEDHDYVGRILRG